jgi:translation initiation factor IF-2
METIQVGELAKKLNLKPGEVIGKLMKMGEMVTITQAIDADTAALVASEYGCETKVVSLFDETVIEEQMDKEEERTNRPPVVTIMGHVDHGKTKLLDTIRKSNVIDTEAGAITQHIGAYQVETGNGRITFLDTPGHEAFTAMRARGAAVTDIVVLVVAADDGVKEQTVEAIRHAQEAGVPIIVAINKIDLEAANPDRVKQELVQYGLQSEDWGGQTIFVEISAKQNIGIENLLEMILLQAELLDLRANPEIRAVGHVIEARIDPGKGPVATILVEKGTLEEGDPYVVGIYSGRVRAMFDDRGKRVKTVGPASPVEITGIDGVPDAGDPFTSVENEKFGREIAGKRQHYKHVTESALKTQPSLKDLKSWIQDHKEVKVIIKADVQGSVEAIKDGLLKLSNDEVQVRVIHGATGAISVSDVSLASASNAVIVGFQVRATPQALEMADQNRVDIKYYSIIYNVIEDITASLEGLLEPEKVEEVTGQAEVRQIFRISRIGNIAGCMVKSGKINRKSQIRVIRENVVVNTTEIKGLRREKDDVPEISEGFECGISLTGFNDLKEGDILEAFEIKEVARKLNA